MILKIAAELNLLLFTGLATRMWFYLLNNWWRDVDSDS